MIEAPQKDVEGAAKTLFTEFRATRAVPADA
jgi:hypothetical protein